MAFLNKLRKGGETVVKEVIICLLLSALLCISNDKANLFTFWKKPSRHQKRYEAYAK